MGLGQLPTPQRAGLAPAHPTRRPDTRPAAGGDSRRTPTCVVRRREPDQPGPARPVCGRETSKQNRSAGSPDTASAVVTADGPARHPGPPRRTPPPPVARSLMDGIRRPSPPGPWHRWSARRPGRDAARPRSVEQARSAGDPHTQRLRQRPHPAGVLGGDTMSAAPRALDEAGRGVPRLAQRRGSQQQSAGIRRNATYGHRNMGADDRSHRFPERAAPMISPGPLAPVADFGPPIAPMAGS